MKRAGFGAGYVRIQGSGSVPKCHGYGTLEHALFKIQDEFSNNTRLQKAVFTLKIADI